MAPDVETGKKYAFSDKDITDMNAEEVVETFKEKASMMGENTSKAFTNLKDKFQSGELKEDTKKTFSDLGERVTGLFGSLA